MWRELAENSLQAQLAEGVTEEQLQAAETDLGTRLPDGLRELLAETDGVVGEDGLDLIWPLQRIVTTTWNSG